MLNIKRTRCCGVSEADGLTGKSKLDVLEIAKYTEHDGGVYLLITDKARSTKGSNLIKYLTKHRLGTVIKLPSYKNKNSGNMLSVWMFRPNRKALTAYLDKALSRLPGVRFKVGDRVQGMGRAKDGSPNPYNMTCEGYINTVQQVQNGGLWIGLDGMVVEAKYFQKIK